MIIKISKSVSSIPNRLLNHSSTLPASLSKRFLSESDRSGQTSANSTQPNSLSLAEPITIKGCMNQQALIIDIDRQLADKRQSIHTIRPINIDIGIDEVGRGPLYGSVVVAGVILPHRYSEEIDLSPLQGTQLALLTDSKKLTETKRLQLCPLIQQTALGYLTVEIPAAVIDEVNILQATMTAMRLACEQLIIEAVPLIEHRLQQHLEQQPEQCLQNSEPILIDNETDKDSHNHNATQQWQIKLLIDGNNVPDMDWQCLQAHGIYNSSDSYRDTFDFDKDEPDSFNNRPNNLNNKKVRGSVCSEAWIKGDARHTAIAAASVLAKVARDTQLIKEGSEHPGYGLEQHKGYPTKAHIAAIQTLGVLPQHRRSFKPVRQALDALL